MAGHSDEKTRKLEIGLPYLLKHNQNHENDIRKWIQRAREGRQDEVAADLEKVLELSEQISRYFEKALSRLKQGGAPVDD